MPDFNQLRTLADLLDLHLGVERRKRILQGNEKLTLGTDPNDWTIWMDSVQNRLSNFGGTDFAKNLMRNVWVVPSSDGLQSLDKN
jgi:hypothetical protein